MLSSLDPQNRSRLEQLWASFSVQLESELYTTIRLQKSVSDSIGTKGLVKLGPRTISTFTELISALKTNGCLKMPFKHHLLGVEKFTLLESLTKCTTLLNFTVKLI